VIRMIRENKGTDMIEDVYFALRISADASRPSQRGYRYDSETRRKTVRSEFPDPGFRVPGVPPRHGPAARRNCQVLGQDSACSLRLVPTVREHETVMGLPTDDRLPGLRVRAGPGCRANC
jgi:hypothetical protein